MSQHDADSRPETDQQVVIVAKIAEHQAGKQQGEDHFPHIPDKNDDTGPAAHDAQGVRGAGIAAAVFADIQTLLLPVDEAGLDASEAVSDNE